jgi:protein-S-isoprenylcysteine O-methyltransferase Ste14
MSHKIRTETRKASPVGSMLIGLLTLVALNALGYPSPGFVILVSAGTAALSYIRPKGSGLFLAASMLLPIYWLFMGDAAQDKGKGPSTTYR